jgi:FkbM family methyltransferase
MKVDKLIARNQHEGWFERVTAECAMEYPIHLITDINKDELVIDAGCNVGGFVEAFKSRFNKFLSIDASSYNIEQYQSHHHHPTIHKALYSVDGEVVKLRKYMGDGDNDSNSGNFGITGFVNEGNNHGYRSEEYEEVQTLSLETILKDIEEVGLLKIDIEGGEYEFLYNKDLSKIKWITGEFHNWLFQFGDRGVELLEWIGKTHDEVHSDGDGNNSHYVKLYKRK